MKLMTIQFVSMQVFNWKWRRFGINFLVKKKGFGKREEKRKRNEYQVDNNIDVASEFDSSPVQRTLGFSGNKNKTT